MGMGADQQALAQQADSTRHAFLPGVGYNSDDGFGAGMIYQMVNYHVDVRPYRYFYRLQGNASTKGVFNMLTEFEKRQYQGNRMNALFYGERIANAFYFGLGEASTFDKNLWEDGFYDYERWFFFLKLTHGISLLREDAFDRIEWVYGLQFEYLEVIDISGKLLELDNPRNANGSWLNMVHTGILFDFRDSVFRPTTGHRAELTASVAPGFAGNGQTIGKLTGTFSFYRGFHVIRDVVFAGRVGVSQAIGKAPFFALSTLGGPEDVRGYPFGRFRDHGAVFYNAELRTWLFKLPILEMEIGGQLFFDGGKIHRHPFDTHMLRNHRISYGFGGITSMFNPDFLIRGDIGFSDELWRLNVSVGYMF